MNKQPFLSIITRCYKRPQLLQNNIKSVKCQTDPDYEQIFIVDKVGHGLAAADQALNKYKEYVNGKFVMVLDDDDRIKDSKFIELIKSNSTADIIIWRGQFKDPNTVLPPLDENWKYKVVKTQIGSFNYAVTNKLFKKYIHVCFSGETGDFDFISCLFNQKPFPKIIWLENIFVECQIKGKGIRVTSIEQRGHHRILRRSK